MANRFVLNETSYHGKGAINEIATEIKAINKNVFFMILIRLLVVVVIYESFDWAFENVAYG
mgnify:CR=1 FL=1